VILGFAVEGATELYQFLQRGNLVQGPLAYYSTLATTVLGFILMFLGFREWNAFHPKVALRPHSPAKKARTRFLVGLWLAGTAMIALLDLALGGGGSGSAPDWLAWPVGGLLVLAIGDFFAGLRTLAARWATPAASVVGWTAFLWSTGVAVVAGLVVGDRVVVLLSELVSNWVALVASFGPVVVAMSPLVVGYALMIGAYVPALRHPEHRFAALPTR
jgi:hypothetical protein